MWNRPDGLLFSASDLLNFMGCRHSTALDLRRLTDPMVVAPSDPMADLLAHKGIEHERAYLETLRRSGRSVGELDEKAPLEQRVARTREAMRDGVDIIYQGALLRAPWQGYSDFLERVERPSLLGPWSYEVLDTKLARGAKPKHVIQLSVYSTLLGFEQGVAPEFMHLVLGDGTKAPFRVSDFVYYQQAAALRFLAFAGAPTSTAADPCGHCELCRWRECCAAEWEAADHLSLVASITRLQRRKLQAEGVTSVRALALVDAAASAFSIQPQTLERLRTQARLQDVKRRTGENTVEMLPPVADRGFARLPRPDPGDLFFDMEGLPIFDATGGLEYLFGFASREDDEVRFTPFWAHDRGEEKQAFEAAVDFIAARLAAHPGAHVYHYAAYEPTALKHFMMLHGTREVEVDNFLREHKLVDLYKVVREGIQVSEPSYSLKNIEHFYRIPREGEITAASDSIVAYDQWRELRDPALLRQIADYNAADCSSTLLCRDWLLNLRPDGVAWFSPPSSEEEKPESQERRRLAEERAAAVGARLLSGTGEAERPWRELVAHLLQFHRREAKPEYWAMFHRQELAEEDLIEDADCIGCLRPPDPAIPPRPEKRSLIHTFTFPAQEYKLHVGSTPLVAHTLKGAGEIVAVDEDALTVSLKIGKGAPPYEECFSLIPGGPVNYDTPQDAVYRYAEAVIARTGGYPAVIAILTKAPPCIDGIVAGAPIVRPDSPNFLADAVSAICRLEESYLLVQGPPGAGKTYTSSHAIVELLAQGRRVGVSSHSHKAINNLLEAVEAEACRRGVSFCGAKKYSSDDQRFEGTVIKDVKNNADIRDDHQLVAGTAWLFARPEFDQVFDYVFIDEAGQVSLANTAAIGVSARNIVLVGDQMQLAQPLKGVHPGQSGCSSLEYLLGSLATVPPDRGIFLAKTRRMHPDICRFISDAVYDGRLLPDDSNAQQRLVLGPSAEPALRASGIRFVPIAHEHCTQKSEAEAERIADFYASLLRQRWTDETGATRPISPADILVVSPYNVQVNHLKSVLPAGARVGTVDKFQGQEAPVVLISMATSSVEDIPRNLEFLFSRNRLNVAISRARGLAVIFASPKLLEIPCRTIEQMRLVNTFCWVKAYADELDRTEPDILMAV
jgi:uncharacterized protein